MYWKRSDKGLIENLVREASELIEAINDLERIDEGSEELHARVAQTPGLHMCSLILRFLCESA